jgi:hypothetical protein
MSTVEKPQYARCSASRGVSSVKGAQHADTQLAKKEETTTHKRNCTAVYEVALTVDRHASVQGQSTLNTQQHTLHTI